MEKTWSTVSITDYTKKQKWEDTDKQLLSKRNR